MSVFPIGQENTNLFTDYLERLRIGDGTNTGVKVDEWGRSRKERRNSNASAPQANVAGQ